MSVIERIIRDIDRLNRRLDRLEGRKSAPDPSGWIPPGETWTYASGTTFTIAGDLTDKYQAGDFVRFVQSSTIKHGCVTGVAYSAPNTTVTIAGDAIANAAISGNYYSKAASPQGVDNTDDWAARIGKRALMWHGDAIVTAGNALTRAYYANQMYAARAYQDGPADGDTFTHGFMLRAGTYTFAVFGITSTSRGIIDWYVDDVLIESGQDWYSAAEGVNTTKTTASVAITYDGWHVLKGVINGKNASSSNYYMILTRYRFYPAAD